MAIDLIMNYLRTLDYTPQELDFLEECILTYFFYENYKTLSKREQHTECIGMPQDTLSKIEKLYPLSKVIVVRLIRVHVGLNNFQL